MLGRGKRNPRDLAAAPQKMTAAWTTIELGLGVIGVLLVVLGALIGAQWEKQIDAKFQQEMVLTPESKGFSDWQSPRVPIISKIYFWNWTNPMDIGKPGYKPVVEEVGPYVFLEKHHKVNITWNDNGTVTYRQMKFYHFQPELSSGDLSDYITSVNVVAASLAEMSHSWGKWAQMSLSIALVSQKQKIYWTKTVAELTFDGFHNPIQSFGSIFSSSTKAKFGYFYDFNGTISSDVFSMYTGENDIYTLGDVAAFNYQTNTSVRMGNCSQYQGSIGELWRPHLNQESVLVMFTPDMCRTISYYYESESEHNGISTLVYSSSPLTVDNGSLVEGNACFCDPKGCLPSGLYDLRSCKFGAPVFMSLPHLYLADQSYHDAVEGMMPEPERHKFALEMEPRTGVPLKVAARLQLNVRITKNQGLTMFRNVETVLMPIWWMETIVSLPPSKTSDIQLLLTIIFFGPYIAGLVVVIGSVLLSLITIRRYNACRAIRHSGKISGVDDKTSYAFIGRSEVSSTKLSDCPTVPMGSFMPSDRKGEESSKDEKELAPLTLTNSEDAEVRRKSSSSEVLDYRL